MATLDLQVGMASQYFVADPKKMLAIVEKPSVAVSSDVLTLEGLAEVLVTIYNQSLSAGFLGIRSKPKLESQPFVAFLNDLIQERKPSLAMMTFPNPVLLLSTGFEKTTLNAMKVLKLRGLCQLVGIDISASGQRDLAFRLALELREQQVARGASWQVFAPPKQLCVVSGMKRSVISTEQNINQLLRTHADLATVFDPAAMNEPLLQ